MELLKFCNLNKVLDFQIWLEQKQIFGYSLGKRFQPFWIADVKRAHASIDVALHF